MKKWTSLALIVCISVLVGAFLLEKDSVRNYPPKNSTVVAFGDSLIEGVGSTRGNDLVSRLSRDVGIPIVNLGVSGDTTADGVERIHQVLEYDPGVVIVLLGGNDFLRNIPKETTEENLRKIIETLQDKGALVILLGVRGGILSDAYRDMYEELSQEYEAVYISDVLEGLLTEGGLMADAIHPNDQGYARIADRVSPVLKGVLE